MSPLLFLILIPFVAVLFMAIGAPARFTALLATGLNLLLSLFLFAHYDQLAGGWQYLQEIAVLPEWRFNFSLGADGLSLTMLLLTTLVSLAAIWVTPKIEKNETLFYTCLLLISGGLVGAFASINLFFLYGFHEIALIPVFIMIGIWGSGDRQAAAWKATLYLGAGSFLVLIGILALYLSAPEGLRTFDVRSLLEMAQSDILHPGSWIYLVLLVGLGTLVSLFPFHSWAPATYSSAPPSTAMLHAGVLKKFGLYALLRFVLPLFPDAVAQFSNLLLALLVGNILYIGYVTLAQRRLDWTIAYSSVMHMGTIFLGLASMNIISLTGAALLMFGHGVSVALLFALCGAVRRRTGTLEYSELGGLAKIAPRLSLFFGFATMASLGLPGFTNFAGEVLIFFGATATAVIDHGSLPFIVATIAAVWGVVLSAIYMLRAYRAVFFGPFAEPNRWAEFKKSGFKVAAADEGQGVDGAQQLSVHGVLEGASTGATQPFAAAVDCEGRFKDLLPFEYLPAALLITVLLITGIFPKLLLKILTIAFS